MGGALSRPLGSIRALCRPISPVGLNTGSGSGYVLTALRAYAYATALFRYRSIRALCRPISPVGLNTGSCHPGVALRLPRAVFWRPFRALPSHSPNQSRPHRGRPFPIAKSITPALRASIPPRQISHICRRQMSIPHRHLWRGGGRQAGGEVNVHSPSQNQSRPRRGRLSPSPNFSHLP